MQNYLYLVSDLYIRAIIVVIKDILKCNGGNALNKEEKVAREHLLHVYHHRCSGKFSRAAKQTHWLFLHFNLKKTPTKFSKYYFTHVVCKVHFTINVK
jgi:hypothetical protein